MSRNNIRWRLIAEGIQNTLFYTLFPFIVLYLSGAWGEAKASLSLAIVSLIGVIAGLWGGRLADLFGRKRVMIWTSMGFFIALFLFVIGRQLHVDEWVYLSFGIMGVSYSMYVPVGRAYIADWVNEAERKKIYASLYRIFNLAVIIGPLIGGFVFESMPDWFVLLSFISVGALFCITYFATPESRKMVGVENISRTGFIYSLTLVWKDRLLLKFVIGSVLAAQAFMQLEILLPAKLYHDWNETTLWGIHLDSTKYYAALLMANGIMVVLFNNRFARFSDRYSMFFGFVTSSLLYAVSMLMFAFANGAFIYGVALVIFTIGELMIVSIQDNYIAQIAKESERAQYFAAANIRYSIGRILAPQLLAMVPVLGYSGAFVTAKI